MNRFSLARHQRSPRDRERLVANALASPSRWPISASNVFQTYAASFRAVGARLVALLIAAVAVLASSRIIVETYGAEVYGVVFLITSLPGLLYFLDVGAGGAVTKVFAEREEPIVVNRRLVMLSGYRVTSTTALILAGSALATFLFADLGSMLGIDSETLEGANRSIFLCLLILSAMVPLSLANGALVGLGRLSSLALISVPGQVLSLGGVAVSAALEAPSWIIPPILVLGQAIPALLATLLLYKTAKIPTKELLIDVARVRTRPGGRVKGVMLSVLIISIAIPLFSSGLRIIVGHLGTLRDLAELTLSLQLFMLCAQILGAAGLALWPVYARRRAENDLPFKEVLWVSALFGAIGAAMATVIFFGAPLASAAVTGSQVELSGGTVAALGLFLIAYAAFWPAGMVMTTSSALRTQAALTLASALAALTGAGLLVPRMGAAGALLSSAIAYALFRVVGTLMLTRTLLIRSSEDLTIDVYSGPGSGST
jgi:O-antigen/teichoic acid export membrane protein